VEGIRVFLIEKTSCKSPQYPTIPQVKSTETMASFLRTAFEGIVTLAFASIIYLGGNPQPIPDGDHPTGNRKKRKRIYNASNSAIQVGPPAAKKKKRNRP
jgi:hypothetical protein